MTHEAFGAFIDRNTWIFAKTYAAFCPHEYVVKERLSPEDQQVFPEIVQFIRDEGFVAIYGRKAPNRYYTVDEYYYWTMGEPVGETDILNRAKVSEYEFVPTERGLVVKWKG